MPIDGVRLVSDGRTYVDGTVGPKGARRADYLEITEQREGPGYGWCGDWATWLLYRWGCQDGTFLNRAILNGKWTPGDNIARLQRAVPRVNHLSPSALREAVTGDILIYNTPNGGHICFLDTPVKDDGSYVTLDGNSWMGVVANNTRRVGGSPALLEILQLSAIPSSSPVAPWASADPVAPTQPGAAQPSLFGWPFPIPSGTEPGQTGPATQNPADVLTSLLGGGDGTSLPERLF